MSFVILTAPNRLVALIVGYLRNGSPEYAFKINFKVYEALSYTLILYPLHTAVNRKWRRDMADLIFKFKRCCCNRSVLSNQTPNVMTSSHPQLHPSGALQGEA